MKIFATWPLQGPKKHSYLKAANRHYEVNYDKRSSFNPREALHVGQMPFPNPGDVYFSMINVFMETQMHDIEFVLNAGYKTLIYDGNFDIICNHSGILDMIADMQWDGKADYDKVEHEQNHRCDGICLN